MRAPARLAVLLCGGAVLEQAARAGAMVGTTVGASDAHGWAIEGEYIARVRAGDAQGCEQQRATIAALREQVLGGAEREPESGRASAIGALCLVAFRGDAEVARAVANLSAVQYVEPNSVVRAMGSPPSWGLSRIDQPELPLSSGVPFTISHRGAGVQIYVLDTGVLATHDDFGGRAVYAADFVEEGFPEDGMGHGTHTASTAAGASYGVASAASINAVKVLGALGGGTMVGVIAGIEWAVVSQQRRFPGESGVISMSLGGPAHQALNDAVAAASSAGMIVVVAAGNFNSDAALYSPAGAGGSGARGGVIAVGATEATDARAFYSNFGASVDLFAPGSGITAAWIGSPTAANTVSGTSMATPHVAGVAAALLEKHGKNKSLAVQELFALTVECVSDARSPRGLLLQAPTYTGPPTPPTTQPTGRPSTPPMPEPQVCVGGACFAFKLSQFGPQSFPADRLIAGPALEPLEDSYACAALSKDYTGVVLVVRRGNCYFQTKVRNAERAGAVAVIITLAEPGELIAPASDGSEDVGIMSAAISFEDGDEARKRKYEIATFGLRYRTATPNAAQATRFPTTPSRSPSSAPSAPSSAQSGRPSDRPSRAPSKTPSEAPTTKPSGAPSKQPTTASPNAAPTTASPSSRPSDRPTKRPTKRPNSPSSTPSTAPTRMPSRAPTSPSAAPSKQPTTQSTSAAPVTPRPSSSRPTRRPTR